MNLFKRTSKARTNSQVSDGSDKVSKHNNMFADVSLFLEHVGETCKFGRQHIGWKAMLASYEAV